MTGKEIIKKAFGLQEVERIPWIPFVGCQGGKLIGKDAEEYLKSAEFIVAGIDEAINRYNPDGLPVMFDLQIEAEALDCDVIALVDPMTSQIGPDQFRQFISPAATEIFSFIRSKGAMGSFFVCGYAQQNIEVMCDCKPDNVSIDENIPLDYVREVCLKNNISFGGNMKLTVVLLMGTKEDCQTHAMECMELAGNSVFIKVPVRRNPLSEMKSCFFDFQKISVYLTLLTIFIIFWKLNQFSRFFSNTLYYGRFSLT